MLDGLRVRLEGVLEELERERLGRAAAGGVGRGPGAVWRGSRELFELDRISEVQRALAGATGDEERRIRALLEALAHGRAECAAAEELDEVVAWEATNAVEVGDERLPIREILPTLAGTADPELRHRIENAYLEALDDELPLLQTLHARRREAVEELGYGSYLTGSEFLSGIDLTRLADDAADFLAETDSLHRELLAWHLPRVAGVPVADATVADGLRLARAPHLDDVFTGRDLTRTLETALARGGLDTRGGGRIAVRVQRSSGRPGGATTHPVRVPEDVVVAVRLRPGRQVYAAFLRAMGEALHAVHTPADLPLEDRRLGDRSVPFAAGLLFESLLSTRAFVTRELEMPADQLTSYLRFSGTLELLRVRSLAAQHRFETEWGAAPGVVVPDRHAELLTAASGVGHDRRAALLAVRPGFAAARRLRASLLAPLLHARMRDRFDEDWYRNPRASGEMRGILSTGRVYGASELALQLASEPIGFAPFLRRLEELAD